jgi:proton glutamate symport protein
MGTAGSDRPCSFRLGKGLRRGKLVDPVVDSGGKTGSSRLMAKAGKVPLHTWILASVVVGAGAGLAVRAVPAGFAGAAQAVFDFLGSLFLNALKMITVPLVASAVADGVAKMGGGREVGRLGVKTVVYYLSTTLVAVLLGLVLVNVIRPGEIGGHPAREELGLAAEIKGLPVTTGAAEQVTLPQLLLRMVPTNVIRAAAEGDLLGLIVFALLFGFFAGRVPDPAGGSLRRVIEALFQAMMRLTEFILRFAPIGIFGLVARTIAQAGFEAWRPLLWFFTTVALGLLLHSLGTLSLLLVLFGRLDPRRHLRAMAPALLTAFSTSSSSATVPVTLECVERRAGVSNRVSSFVIPLGATVNMDGTALYECVAAMFIAQAYGLHLTFGVQFTVVALATLTSIGVAGIPSASLVAIVMILQAIGLPAEGLGLILAVDRVLDMGRTAVNVYGDTCGAVIVAKSEGETGVLADPSEAAPRGGP